MFVLHIPHVRVQRISTTNACRALPRSSLNSSEISRRSFLHFAVLLPAVATSTYAADYDRYAATYDVLDGSSAMTRQLGFDSLRAELLSRAHGNILEIAAGTGVNYPFYPRQTLKSLVALDASLDMLNRADKRGQSLTPPLVPHNIIADAENTGLLAGKFDTIVVTFGLCVFPHPESVMCEMRRLVSPAGSVLIMDYTLSQAPAMAAYQNFAAPIVTRLSKGCTPNLDLPKLARDAGFSVVWRRGIINDTVIAMELIPI